MNLDSRKAIVIAGGATLLFFIIKRIWPVTPTAQAETKAVSSNVAYVATPEQQKNALIVLTAYKAAMQKPESEAFLQEMNQEFYKLYKLRVYKSKGTGQLIVTDDKGNEIK